MKTSRPRRPALAQALALPVLAEVERVFDKAKIPLIPVKGVVTARLLYADPSEREIRDVDVRIPARDFDVALCTAKSAGWPVRAVSRVYRSFVASVGGLDVDVETTIGPPGYCRMSVEMMLSRAQVGPAPFSRTPEIHDHALLLVVNAVKDHLYGAAPYQVEDLRRIVRHRELSVETLCRLAESNRCSFMMHVVAQFLSDEPRFAEIASRLMRDHRLRTHAVSSYLRFARRGEPEIALRILSRLAPDGVVTACLALARAALFELEVRQRDGRTSD